MKTIIIPVILGYSFFVSCGHKTQSERFADYMNDTANHILQKRIINGVELTVKYMTLEFQGNDQAANMLLNVKIHKADMKKDKATSMYLNFEIQNDFQLKTGNELLLPAICQKIENGIAGDHEYMIAFDSEALENSKEQKAELIYNDKIFGVGPAKFIFSKKDILKIPMLTKN